MKRSELYHLAQIAVVTSNCIAPETKLVILQRLMADESMAEFIEEETEKVADAE